jgi:apolipoprotein N-acyltransferase
MQWRKDPDLLRAYGRASWIWVALCLVRAAILIPLIEQNALWGLAISGAFFYLLVIATIISSWIVIKRSLPADHLGLRHPHIPAEPPSDRGDSSAQ